MGCCMSSTTKTGSHQPKAAPPPPPPPSHHHCPPKPHKTHKTSAPKPASFEEESVKEVLSETPVSKPATTITGPTPKTNTENPISQQTKAKDLSFLSQKSKEEEKQRTPEISQASEIYSSVTDTLSAATTATTTTATTTTVTEIREDEATSKKRVLRSPSKVPRKRLYTGERERISASTATKERMPVKRELSGQIKRNAQRNVGTTRVRRDVHGEGSGRRSRSSAARAAAGVGRGRGVGTQAKVTGKAGERSVGAGAAAGGVKEEKENDGGLKEQQQQQGNESLENPLVSLECFIFL